MRISDWSSDVCSSDLDYAGVGPGAHGRIATSEGRLATATLKTPGAWIASVEKNGHGLEVTDPVSANEQGDEMMLMGLRLEEGVSLARYERLTGRALAPARIDSLIR